MKKTHRMRVSETMEREGFYGARLQAVVFVSSPELHEYEWPYVSAGIPTTLWSRQREDWMVVGKMVDAEVVVVGVEP